MYKQILDWWKSKNIETDAELAEALNGHAIAFAYNSGKIENPDITYNDTREIFENDRLSGYTGNLRTIFELRNAKDANEHFLKAFGQKDPISADLILRIQYELTKNTYDTRRWEIGERPGEYKKHDYVTGQEEVGALPDETPEEIRELIDEMADIDEKNALIAAAYFHVKFENIHPFADGNGRTGRMAMNYILVTHNHPPIIIHEEDRKAYYAALESWDVKQELGPMLEFLKDQAEKTWRPYLEREDRDSDEKTSLSDYLDLEEDAR